MGTYKDGKSPRQILFRQATPRARLRSDDLEDTSEFPVQALMIAGIRHNRSSIAPPEPMQAPRKTHLRSSADEITREIPLHKRMGEIPRGVEMMEIWMVQHWLSSRMGSLLPGMSEEELLGLRCRLEAAARDARFVADSRSPKQEFFARLPTELLNPARMMYRQVDNFPSMQ